MIHATSLAPLRRTCAQGVRFPAPSIQTPKKSRVVARFREEESYEELIAEEHSQIRQTMGRIRKTQDPASKKKLAAELAELLKSHGQKEEMALYPSIRDVLGEEVSSHMAAEQNNMDAALDALTAAAPETDMADFEDKFKHVLSLFVQHVKEEERSEFPSLTKAIGEEQALELGSNWEQIKEQLERHDSI